jgi:hypothetical protein
MKSPNKLWIGLALFIFIFTSCNRSNQEGARVPVNASAVMQVNLKLMGEKLSWKEFKQSGWLQKIDSHPSTPDWFRNLFNQPENSGIDFEKGMTFFVDKSLSTTEHFVINGMLGNKKDFEAFVQKIDSTQTIKEVGKVNVLLLKNHDVVGWDDNHFSLVVGNAIKSVNMGSWRDSTTSEIKKPIETDESKIAFCAQLFSLKKDSSLAKNEKFSSLLKEKGDVHIWMNPSEDLKKTPSLGMLSMLKLEKLFGGSFSAFTINFEKGSIDINQKQYLSKDLMEFVKKYTGSNISKEMIEKIPSENVMGVMAANFKPEAVQELAKLVGVDGLANIFLQVFGINLDDISKANNGNLMMAISDFKINETSIMSVPDMNYLMAIGVKDPKSFDKVMSASQKFFADNIKDSSLYLSMNDNYFIAGNNANFANLYFKNPSHQFDFVKELSGHPFGLFFNFQNVLKTASLQKNNDSTLSATLGVSLKMWKEIIVKGGEVKDGALNFNGTIHLMDKEKNSLPQLNNYMNEMYSINRSKMEQYIHEKTLDSLLKPPPIDTVRPVPTPKK